MYKPTRARQEKQTRSVLGVLGPISLIIILASTSFGQLKGKSWTCQPQSAVPVLERRLCNPNIEFSSVKIDELIVRVLEWSETPGGIELISDERETSRRDVNSESLILKDLLNSIVIVEPRYLWQEEHGVINISPANGYSLLNTQVSQFKVEKATQDGLLNALRQTKEFQAELAARALVEAPLSFCCGLSSFSPPRTFSVDLTNATVRQILNEIVRQNGRSIWRYYETSDEKGKHYYKLDFAYHHF